MTENLRRLLIPKEAARLKPSALFSPLSLKGSMSTLGRVCDIDTGCEGQLGGM